MCLVPDPLIAPQPVFVSLVRTRLYSPLHAPAQQRLERSREGSCVVQCRDEAQNLAELPTGLDILMGCGEAIKEARDAREEGFAPSATLDVVEAAREIAGGREVVEQAEGG